MNRGLMIHVVGNSLIHRADARVKIASLFVFSLAVFVVGGWWPVALGALCVMGCVVLARIPLRLIAPPLLSVLVLGAFASLFAFIAQPSSSSLIQSGQTACRMLVLMAASLIVCYTSDSDKLVQAFAWFIAPLRMVHVPVRDVAFTLTLALRFIPVIFQEFEQVRKAQRVRGAELKGLSLRRKLEIWGAAFAAIFIGIFRHADSLATAMDARCYGACDVKGRAMIERVCKSKAQGGKP